MKQSAQKQRQNVATKALLQEHIDSIHLEARQLEKHRFTQYRQTTLAARAARGVYLF